MARQRIPDEREESMGFGISGTGDKGRIAFEQIIAAAENGRDFDTILCYDIRRAASRSDSDFRRAQPAAIRPATRRAHVGGQRAG